MLTLRINLTPEARETIAMFSRVADWKKLGKRIAAVMGDQDELTVGHIQQRYISQAGPTTLAVRQARLWKSLRPRKPVLTSNAVISGFGSNVIYLGPHEFGFEGTVTVKAHNRRYARFASIYNRLMPISLKDAEQLQGRSKKVNPKLKFGVAHVRQHTRKMNLPARAPLLRGTLDRVDDYARAVSNAIVEEFR